MIDSSTPQLAKHEAALVLLDLPPWNALYRIGIGAAILPAYDYLFNVSSSWYLVIWFIGVLISLRLIPAVIRKALPFSRELRSIWAERRVMAKRFDSYQWRKLFWIGIGMGASGPLLDPMSQLATTLIALCLIGGTIGIIVFRSRTTSAEQLTQH